MNTGVIAHRKRSLAVAAAAMPLAVAEKGRLGLIAHPQNGPFPCLSQLQPSHIYLDEYSQNYGMFTPIS